MGCVCASLGWKWRCCALQLHRTYTAHLNNHGRCMCHVVLCSVPCMGEVWAMRGRGMGEVWAMHTPEMETYRIFFVSAFLKGVSTNVNNI